MTRIGVPSVPPGTFGPPIPPGTFAQGLTATAVKTGPYAAAPKDYVLVDTTAGTVAITLPTAPADGTKIGVKIVAPSPAVNVATFACGGSDHINLTTGPTTGTVSLTGQAVILQYATSNAVWTVQSNDLPLSQLDTRFAKVATSGTLAARPAATVIGQRYLVTDVGGALHESLDGSTWTQMSPGIATGVSVTQIKKPTRTISSVVTAFQTGHGFTSSGTGATWTLNDTTDYCWGTQSVKVVTGGNAAACLLSKLGGTAFDITGKVLLVPVKVADLTHLSLMTLYLGSASFANFYLVTLSPGSVGQPAAFVAGEWFLLEVDLSEASITGSPALNNITDIRFQARDDGVGPITVSFGGLALVPDSSAKFANGVVTFSADDNYATQFSLMRPVLDAAGVQATLHIIADTMGTTGVLTVAQAQAMQNLSGFEIGGHAYYYANHGGGGYPAKTLDVVEDDLRKLRDYLSSNGFNGLDFAWPGGAFTPALEALVLRYFNSARVTQGQPREFVPPNCRSRIRVVSLVPTKTLAQAKADVDRAYTYKQWLNFTIHDMSTGSPTGAQWQQSDFISLVAYIQAKPMPIRTTADVIAA